MDRIFLWFLGHDFHVNVFRMSHGLRILAHIINMLVLGFRVLQIGYRILFFWVDCFCALIVFVSDTHLGLLSLVALNRFK